MCHRGGGKQGIKAGKFQDRKSETQPKDEVRQGQNYGQKNTDKLDEINGLVWREHTRTLRTGHRNKLELK